MLAPIALVGDEDPAPLQVEAVDVGLVEVGRAVDMTRRAERRERPTSPLTALPTKPW
jgi:hypothetical protein